MPDLALFQRSFARAVMADESADWPFRAQAFAVYRNTSARGAVEALRAVYPTVDMLVGAEMFADVALDYRSDHPPTNPLLSDYGANFADYLAGQPWTSELPYLADVARLDRLWLESFLAGAAASLPRPIEGRSRISLHPAARFAWLATPALTIWQAHRDPLGLDEFEPEWREEGALFTRPGLDVRVQPLEPASCHLLRACSVPTAVEDCVASVVEAFPQSDVPDLLQRCLAAGALIIQ